MENHESSPLIFTLVDLTRSHTPPYDERYLIVGIREGVHHLRKGCPAIQYILTEEQARTLFRKGTEEIVQLLRKGFSSLAIPPEKFECDVTGEQSLRVATVRRREEEKK